MEWEEGGGRGRGEGIKTTTEGDAPRRSLPARPSYIRKCTHSAHRSRSPRPSRAPTVAVADSATTQRGTRPPSLRNYRRMSTSITHALHTKVNAEGNSLIGCVKNVPCPCGPYVDRRLDVVGIMGGGTAVGGMIRVATKSSKSWGPNSWTMHEISCWREALIVRSLSSCFSFPGTTERNSGRRDLERGRRKRVNSWSPRTCGEEEALSLVDVHADLTKFEGRVSNERKPAPGHDRSVDLVSGGEVVAEGEREGGCAIHAVQRRSASQGNKHLPGREDIVSLDFKSRKLSVLGARPGKRK